MKPLFIVFEGIDGSGKTTQAERLKDYFIKEGEPAVISPEPSTGLIGKLIREALQKSIIAIQNQHRFEEQMAYLFAADRHYHLYNDEDGVFKLIHQDQTHVITPRYYFSSLAYNCHTQAEYDFVSRLNQSFPAPDLVVYLDIPVEVAMSRIAERAERECYEEEAKLTQVSLNYERIFETYSGLLLTLDGTQPEGDLQQTIIEFLANYFN
jgi:dTMP kinase